MTTCWESPEKCPGCHYCRTARDEGVGIYPLTPLEAHQRDLVDDDIRRAAKLPVSDVDVTDRMLAARAERRAS